MEETLPNARENAGEDVPGHVSDGENATAPAKKSSRRRTKTGCLTCRKRRIKCGEEHPICKNCVKSKRDCEGYKQPVVFKHPANDYHPIGYPLNPAHYGLPYGGGHPPGFLPHLAPTEGSSHPTYDPDWAQWTYRQQDAPSGLNSYHYYSEARWTNNHLETHRPEDRQNYALHDGRYTWQPSATPVDFAPPSADHAPPPEEQYWSGQPNPQPPYRREVSFRAEHTSHSEVYPSEPTTQHPSTTTAYSGDVPFTNSSNPVKRESISPATNEKRYNSFGFVQHTSFDIPNPAAQTKSSPKITPPPQIDKEEDDEDDPWDVDFDFADPESMPRGTNRDELNSLLVKFATGNDRRSRTFTAFLDGPSVLATYYPSTSASPLNDEKVARIFCQFVSVTGPCLSIFERQASQSTMTFSNSPIPAPQKTLWTYVLPSLALHNPALLHAMLAVSALHISKLQETPEDPAIKHYTYAVRRVGKLLGLPGRRHETATLAANLLVGFYEVVSSDHSRWNVHLAGAKVLVMEIDFAKLTRVIRRMRARARQNVAGQPAMSYEEWLHIVGIPESLLDDRDWEIDEDLVSKLTGYHVEYDRQCQPNFPAAKDIPPDLTSAEIDDFKVKSDLYWWYCKQDVFQSMVSGDPLLMPHRRWIYCPPRGQIGKPDAAYGTMDHLILIMARLTDFGGKDRVRKVRMVKAQGGQWKPPPHFFGFNKPPPMPRTPTAKSSPSAHTPPGVTSNGNGQQDPHDRRPMKHPSTDPASQPSSGPGFYGMMPHSNDPNPPEMHSAFRAMNANIYDQAFYDPAADEGSVHSSSSQTLDDDTAAALKEHADIVNSFEVFFHSLGESYQPLGADSCPPISTPFGPALQYRTYPISCIWAFYYVGRILIHRFHPHMPPAAMVAAGVTAHLTADYAQTVGRICAGLFFPQQYSLQTGTLNPTLGAALQESTFSLFFAAVQFQDASQRGWTISKLRDIALKTGWQTSATIAAACEVTWERLGEAGKGPPYVTTMDRDNTDLRVRRKNKMGDPSVKEEDGTSAGPSLPAYNRDAIHTNQSTRVHWALGLLSVEKDIEQLNLDKE